MEEQIPRDFEALRAAIYDRRQTLPKRIAQVAAYALDNPDNIAFGTTASIAASAGVQPSTLIRFSQLLGFDGFTSMQVLFRDRLRERTPSYDERLAALRAKVNTDADHRSVLDGFVAAATTSLGNMARTIDEAQLDKAVSVLAKAETIYILGRRRSYPIASYLAYALGKLGVRSQLVESASGLNAEIIGFATPADAAIALSFAPYASETIEETASISALGASVVAITDSAFSPLAQSANVWLEIAEADFAGFRSLSASTALAMTLAVSVAEKRRTRRKKR